MAAYGVSAAAGRLSSAYSEGFGLPDVGILLRSVTTLGQEVNKLVSLEPVVTSSKDIGLNLRRNWGSLGVSAYESYSSLGSTLRIGSDGLGQVVRVPTRVRGIEGTAEVRPYRRLGALRHLFADRRQNGARMSETRSIWRWAADRRDPTS